MHWHFLQQFLFAISHYEWECTFLPKFKAVYNSSSVNSLFPLPIIQLGFFLKYFFQESLLHSKTISTLSITWIGKFSPILSFVFHFAGIFPYMQNVFNVLPFIHLFSYGFWVWDHTWKGFLTPGLNKYTFLSHLLMEILSILFLFNAQIFDLCGICFGVRCVCTTFIFFKWVSIGQKPCIE